MKFLAAATAILGVYASAGQAAYLCDPNVGGAGCIQCSDSFCDYGSDGTGYLCFKSISDAALDTSVAAINTVNQEAKTHLESANADIKAMAEGLVNLTVKEAEQAQSLRRRKAKMHIILPDPKSKN